MQVNSSVTTGYYTTYQRNKGAEYDGGIFRLNPGKDCTKETAEASSVAKGSSYQNLPKAWMTQGAEASLSYADKKGITEEEIQEILQEKIRELFVKVQNQDTEPTFQIGAQSFTEKEWDKFLEKFDSLEEAIRELTEEEREREAAEQEQNDKKNVIEDVADLLTAESTSCVYPTKDPKDDDIRYITWYTEEGIFCRKAGQTEGYEWSIAFEDKEQYDEVMEFIGQFSSDWNMRFAAHENFWKDFLSGELDREGFMEFINGTNKGVPDFSITKGDSVYIDTDKVQWAKYTNPLGAKFYTAEEMHRMQAEIVAANEAELVKNQLSFEEIYKKDHPNYNGEKIFCEYPGGPLYSANEIDELKWQEMIRKLGITEEEYYRQQAEWKA